MLFIGKNQGEHQVWSPMQLIPSKQFQTEFLLHCKVCGVVYLFVSGLWSHCYVYNKLLGDRAFEDLSVYVRCGVCSESVCPSLWWTIWQQSGLFWWENSDSVGSGVLSGRLRGNFKKVGEYICEYKYMCI